MLKLEDSLAQVWAEKQSIKPTTASTTQNGAARRLETSRAILKFSRSESIDLYLSLVGGEALGDSSNGGLRGVTRTDEKRTDEVVLATQDVTDGVEGVTGP